MNKEIKTILKETAKVACVTCVAAGAVAVMTSGAALKVITEGGKYLADAVKRIICDQDTVDGEVVEETPVEAAEEAAPVVAKEDILAEEIQA